MKDRKIPFFEQSISTFFKSKSNWTGIGSIAGGIWLIILGYVDGGATLVGWGAGVLGIRDKLEKMSGK